MGKRIRQISVGRALFSQFIGLFLYTSLSAGEPALVSIQTLFSSQASSFQEHTVSLEGTVRAVQRWPPFHLPSSICPYQYGRAAFVLHDDTGTIPIEVWGSCDPHSATILPRDGDRVRITAIVHVLTSDPSLKVTAQAKTIQILE